MLLLRVARLERGSGGEGKLLDLDGCGKGDRKLSWDILRLSGLVGAIGDKAPFLDVLRLSVLNSRSGERMLSSDEICFRLVDLIGIIGEGGAGRMISRDASWPRVLNGGEEKKVLSREVVCFRLVGLDGENAGRVLSLGAVEVEGALIRMKPLKKTHFPSMYSASHSSDVMEVAQTGYSLPMDSGLLS